ncbi:MAG: GNAT family N-acetyltransferase [Thermoguttaceae bacterium]
MSETDGTIRVREATLEDIDTIVQFNSRMARETEDKELDAAVLRSGVERGLTRPDLCRFFLAEHSGKPVGQAMVTYELSEWRDGTFWWFQSVYVHAEYRRRGVFRALYRHIESLAKDTPDVCGLRLYVEKSNRRAMDVYSRVGMSDAGYTVYEADWSNLPV